VAARAAVTIAAHDVERTELPDKASSVRTRISLKIDTQVLMDISVAAGLSNGARRDHTHCARRPRKQDASGRARDADRAPRRDRHRDSLAGAAEARLDRLRA
jgi:hypothetical protein